MGDSRNTSPVDRTGAGPEIASSRDRILELYRDGNSWWAITNLIASESGEPRREVKWRVLDVITGSRREQSEWMTFILKLWSA